MRSALAFLAAAILVAFAVAAPPVSRAAEPPVDLALVLAVDVSRSITDDEFKLQRRGYANAFLDPRVQRAIASGPNRAVAVSYVEWSSFDEQDLVVDWMVIRDGESAAVFADRLIAAPRSFYSRTSISAGIDFSVQQLARSGVAADRHTIDVSGDGTNNAGRAVTEARDAAVAAGITINGLAIINEHPDNPYVMSHVQPPEGLPEYYRQNVIGGVGSFLMVVQDFDSFAEAVTQKLVSEIAGLQPLRERFAARGRRP
ncbi:MAG TPA: DUF1194 domain-containing protein [Stellaceae bacterium]|jgi:hypothetical protein